MYLSETNADDVVFTQIASGGSHPIKYNVLQSVVKAMISDGRKFAAAHAALEDMLEEVEEVAPLAKVPKIGPTTRSHQHTKRSLAAPKTQPDLPLLLFVVTDYKYHEWDKPQKIKVSVAWG